MAAVNQLGMRDMEVCVIKVQPAGSDDPEPTASGEGLAEIVGCPDEVAPEVPPRRWLRRLAGYFFLNGRFL